MTWLMRITIRLDDRLLREAREFAARTGRTLTAVIKEALREMLARSERRAKRTRVRLPIFRGNGLLPGVDLDDSTAFLEIMDGARDPH